MDDTSRVSSSRSLCPLFLSLTCRTACDSRGDWDNKEWWSSLRSSLVIIRLSSSSSLSSLQLLLLLSCLLSKWCLFFSTESLSFSALWSFVSGDPTAIPGDDDEDEPCFWGCNRWFDWEVGREYPRDWFWGEWLFSGTRTSIGNAWSPIMTEAAKCLAEAAKALSFLALFNNSLPDPSEWKRMMWCLKFLFSENPLPQTLQIQGLKPVWTLSWRWTEKTRSKVLSQ